MTVTNIDKEQEQQPKLRIPKKEKLDEVQPNSKYDRVPCSPPPFNIGDIRRAIPAHCFERSLVKSFAYVAVDLALVAAAMYAATYIDPLATSIGGFVGFLSRTALWTLYWAFTGSVMTGIWVLAHECGHGGFSDYELVNDVVGWVLHSLLLVPYFSWKISHRRHHSNTGSIEHDEVFVPVHTDAPHDDGMEHLPPAGMFAHTVLRLARITLMLTFGWPLYLWANMTGNTTYPKTALVNHFLPSSPIFTTPKEGMQVAISDLGLGLACLFFYKCCQVVGVTNWIMFFFVPYLIVNAFLVTITFLQHTDHVLPHYRGSTWDWLRGALATVDRDYGLLNYFHHHIADTHVAHHLFSSMPHYHAEEATRAIKPLLANYYRFDATPWYVALWRNFHECNVVHPDENPKNKGVYWFY